MARPTDPLDHVVLACEALLRTQDTLTSHRLQRDAALHAAQRFGGYPKTGRSSLASAVEQRMRERGWDEAMIDRVGVSQGAVRAALDRARP